MSRISRKILPILIFLAGLAALAAGDAGPDLDPALRAAIDAAAREALAATGAPSAAVAVVRGGRIAYVDDGFAGQTD